MSLQETAQDLGFKAPVRRIGGLDVIANVPVQDRDGNIDSQLRESMDNRRIAIAALSAHQVRRLRDRGFKENDIVPISNQPDQPVDLDKTVQILTVPHSDTMTSIQADNLRRGLTLNLQGIVLSDLTPRGDQGIEDHPVCRKLSEVDREVVAAETPADDNEIPIYRP